LHKFQIGYDNALVGDSLFGMGAIARDKGMLQPALDFFNKTLELYTKSLGDSHLITKTVVDECQSLETQIKNEEMVSVQSQASVVLPTPPPELFNTDNSNNVRNRRPSHSASNTGSNSFKVKTIRDNSPDKLLTNFGNSEKLARISEISTPKSKLSRQKRPSHTPTITHSQSSPNEEHAIQHSNSFNGFNRVINPGNDKVSFNSASSSFSGLPLDREKPRTIAPPARRRPETARSSWDMEEDYHSKDFVNDVQIDENPEEDIMKFLFNESNNIDQEGGGEEAEGDDADDENAKVNYHEKFSQPNHKDGSALNLPSIKDIMKRAVSRKTVPRRVTVKSTISSLTSLGHSSEVLSNKAGRPIAILSGGFEESYSF
jgi:hypothetical protein